jgi:hypothetical protein
MPGSLSCRGLFEHLFDRDLAVCPARPIAQVLMVLLGLIASRIVALFQSKEKRPQEARPEAVSRERRPVEAGRCQKLGLNLLLRG